MDEIDKQILDRIQSDFPLKKRPFSQLGKELGIEEEELIKRIEMLLDEGYIRRIAPIINSRKIGMVGTLVAMNVPGDRVKEVADTVSEYKEVNHNYERNHDYNIWFTITAESRERIDEILSEIRDKTGIDEIIDLPSKRMYKIGVSFSLS